MGGSGGEGVGQAAETESTLALAENVYVNLPRPYEVIQTRIGAHHMTYCLSYYHIHEVDSRIVGQVFALKTSQITDKTTATCYSYSYINIYSYKIML